MLKRLAWFVFKSPQRRMVGWKTLFTDLRGLAEAALNFLSPGKPQALVVCTGSFNRSRHLFDVLIPSLLRADAGHGWIALSVADCGSTDTAALEDEIRRCWPGTLYFSRKEETFARASVFNRAVRQTQEPLVMLCDADMEVPADLHLHIKRYVNAHLAWFPVCRNMRAPAPSNEWEYLSAGTGICAVRRSHFEALGGLNENYTQWGHEDWDFFFRCYRAGIMPLRNRVYGLVHHYHPSLKPEGFKPMF
ncbi:MAG: glycosyltransferase family 2 protein [Bacteroidota bacterium]|jgi:glycosyltransferase involved in cell wall biosynthesis